MELSAHAEALRSGCHVLQKVSSSRRQSSVDQHNTGAREQIPSLQLLSRNTQYQSQCAEEAGGTGRLPYQSLVNQGLNITVTGLPNSLTLKKPSFYGRNQLEAILNAAEISFEINAAQCNPTNMAEGMSEPMDAEGPEEQSSETATTTVAIVMTADKGPEEQSSETATTTVAIVMTADKGIFPHCGYFYLPGSPIETNELFLIVDLAKTSSSMT
ncbi:hypothetical protein DPX16_7928 [Anabarilius grahami]|uniref:Uncharacterized protein n=1 Tax=Anabarilius grahami TaxID=495550 RepID=A0A3N0Z3C8_ANAGA|nr:hypothetical protein DPX16_7928 [Anabarilius grahami]